MTAKLKPGEPLERMSEFMRERHAEIGTPDIVRLTGLNRSTVKKVLGIMERRGVVVRRRRKACSTVRGAEDFWRWVL